MDETSRSQEWKWSMLTMLHTSLHANTISKRLIIHCMVVLLSPSFSMRQFSEMSLINASRFPSKDPHVPMALRDMALISLALSLICFPSWLSWSINLLTSFSIFSFATISSMSNFCCSTLHPFLHSSTIWLLFGTWSKKRGKVSIGTPAKRASRVEFHLQWLQNPPMEEWDNTFNWPHHGTTIPLSPHLSFNQEAFALATQR